MIWRKMMIKRKDMKDKDLVRDVKRRRKRICKERRLIRADIEEWTRRQQSITPMQIQERFSISEIEALGHYFHLFRGAVIDKGGNVSPEDQKLRHLAEGAAYWHYDKQKNSRAAGTDHGYQPKRPNEKKHYKPGVYAREITVHGFDIKPVPPAGSDAPDA